MPISEGCVDLGNLSPEVLEAISSERRYQTIKYQENQLTVGEWILLLSAITADAAAKWRRHGSEDPLEEVRQVAAAAFACLEQHGAPKRQIPAESPSVLDLGGESDGCKMCFAPIAKDFNREPTAEEEAELDKIFPRPHPAGAEFSTAPKPTSEPEIDLPLTLPTPDYHGEYQLFDGSKIIPVEVARNDIRYVAAMPNGARLADSSGITIRFLEPIHALTALNAKRRAAIAMACGFDVTAAE